MAGSVLDGLVPICRDRNAMQRDGNILVIPVSQHIAKGK